MFLSVWLVSGIGSLLPDECRREESRAGEDSRCQRLERSDGEHLSPSGRAVVLAGPNSGVRTFSL